MRIILVIVLNFTLTGVLAQSIEFDQIFVFDSKSKFSAYRLDSIEIGETRIPTHCWNLKSIIPVPYGSSFDGTTFTKSQKHKFELRYYNDSTCETIPSLYKKAHEYFNSTSFDKNDTLNLEESISLKYYFASFINNKTEKQEIFLVLKQNDEHWILVNKNNLYSFSSLSYGEIAPFSPLVFNSIKLQSQFGVLEYEGMYTKEFAEILRLAESNNNCN